MIDFVGGQEDLSVGTLRAIGDPYARIREDKLRMLRAIRFAARYEFALEQATRQAIVESSEGIHLVSGERIGAELEKILEHPNRQWACSELESCGLFKQIAAELLPLEQKELFAAMPKIPLPLPVVLASMVHPWGQKGTQARAIDRIDTNDWKSTLETIKLRWKLSNEAIESTSVCIEASSAICMPSQYAWSQVQPRLLRGWVQESVLLAERLTALRGWSDEGLTRCRSKLAQPAQEWNPPPWIDGSDLIRAGLKPGPAFGKLLSQARSMQLDEQLTSKQMAKEWLSEQIDRMGGGQ